MGSLRNTPSLRVVLSALSAVLALALVAGLWAVPTSANGPPVFRDALADGSSGPALVRVPPGRFRMGDLRGDGDFDERPAREVTLPRAFLIGRHEVTFADYERYCADAGVPVPDDSGFGRGDHPVVNVNWQDAVAYAIWLSAQTGKRYRLPSEAEWEYVARAGAETRFWWGDEPGSARANCAGCGSEWDSESTAPVGRLGPNPFGVFDVAGNVWEWVADCYNNSYEGVPRDGRPHVYRACGQMVVRGGSWILPAREMRAANRFRWAPVSRSDEVGFRVARELP
jgi:formylglycine-generating enzyme required for sulfatase activity